MMVVALLMRPWVLMAGHMGAVARVLADDVMIIAKGRRMLSIFANVLHATHQFLRSMGSKVAPQKSYNFASSKTARDWLEQTWWVEIGAYIQVVRDLR